MHLPDLNFIDFEFTLPMSNFSYCRWYIDDCKHRNGFHFAKGVSIAMSDVEHMAMALVKGIIVIVRKVLVHSRNVSHFAYVMR